jgi:LysM repeat protein
MARPWSAADERSARDWVCPFLRAIDEDDRLGAPVEAPHPANRCVALREPVPQSLRQQELVCLTSGHVNCPRYLRGAQGTTEPLARVAATRTITPATSGAIALFMVAFVASIVFVVANDGMTLDVAAIPTAAPSGNVLAAVESEAPTAQPTPDLTSEPSAAATFAPTPSPSPTPLATPSPTLEPSPAPEPTPEPTPTAKPTKKPSSSRYDLLTPCPDQADCWVYKIRSGDNLYSIVNYFGVPLATVRAWNPWTADGLKVGRGLRIPPPTR